jgi:outer membrane protein assembly factor BamB
MAGRFAAVLVLSLVVTPPLRARAADWPQFRGPRGDGTSDAINLPLRWGGFDQPAWQVRLPGRGWSSPIVVGDRIWVTSAETTALPTPDRDRKLHEGLYRDFKEQFQAHSSVTLYAIEIHAASGEILRTLELFTSEDPPPIHATNTYASPTPVSDGERLYCHFGSLGTVAVSLASGQVLWRKQFAVDDLTGPGGSPVLHGERLILACDGADAQFVVALEKQSGKELWRTPRPPIDATDPRHRRSFSTPLVIVHDGKSQVVTVAAQWVVSYDPATGAGLWRVDVGKGSHAAVPRPLYRDGLVYVCTGFPKPALWAIRVDGSGDVTGTHVTWRYAKQVPEVSSPVMAGETIYFVSSLGIATALDACTGQPLWQHRLGGNYAASPLAADGKLYFTSQEGVTTVLAAGREYRELATSELFGVTKASLAIAGQSLLLRTEPVLYCVRKPAE